MYQCDVSMVLINTVYGHLCLIMGVGVGVGGWGGGGGGDGGGDLYCLCGTEEIGMVGTSTLRSVIDVTGQAYIPDSNVHGANMGSMSAP